MWRRWIERERDNVHNYRDTACRTLGSIHRTLEKRWIKKGHRAPWWLTASYKGQFMFPLLLVFTDLTSSLSSWTSQHWASSLWWLSTSLTGLRFALKKFRSLKTQNKWLLIWLQYQWHLLQTLVSYTSEQVQCIPIWHCDRYLMDSPYFTHFCLVVILFENTRCSK